MPGNTGKPKINKSVQALEQERKRLKRLRKQNNSLKLQQLSRPKGVVSDFVSQSNNLPYNEQVALQSIIDSDPDKAASGYLKTVVLPQYNVDRIPDSYGGKTALVQSSTIISVPSSFTGTADDGRFSMIVQPHIGALTQPDQYKVAMVDALNPNPWNTDLTNPGAFVSISNNKDIRTDQFNRNLTQPPLSTATYTGDIPSSTAVIPFGTSVTKQSGYGLDVNYGIATGSEFYPPVGFYAVHLRVVDTASTPGDLQITALALNGATVVTSWATASTDGTLGDWTGFVIIPPGQATSPGVSFSANSATAPLTVANIRFTTTYDDIPGISSNGGMTQKYRPVGCSVLATFTGPNLTNGGNIAGAFLPGQAANDQFFNNNSLSSNGNLTAWQNVAQLKGAYNGPIKDGIYMWYSPESILDYQPRTPDESVAYKHPNFVLSGQWAPGGSTAGLTGQVFLRVEIWTVYEVVTDSTFLPTKYQLGDTATMDSVLRHLVGTRHVMENPEHLTFGRRLLDAFKSAGNFLWSNRKTIGSIATAVGALI